MDAIKAAMHRECGVGGLFCDCCNDYHGKDKPKLTRRVRRAQKKELKKDVDNEAIN